MWPVTLLSMLLLQYLISVGLAKQNELLDLQRRQDDSASRLRLDNELRATIWAAQAGVTIPPGDGELRAIPVKPWNLVEAFIGDGGYEYAGKLVAVPLVAYEVEDRSILWWVGGKGRPASLEMRFDGPPKAVGKVWVIGRVLGAERDGVQREHPEVNFKVVLIDCRIGE